MSINVETETVDTCYQNNVKMSKEEHCSHDKPWIGDWSSPHRHGGGSSRSHRLCKLDKLLLRVKTKAGWNTDTHLKCQRATQLVENYQVKVQERKMVLKSVGAAESGPCPRGVTAGDCSKPHPTFMGNLNAGPSEWGWSGETILAKTAAWPCYLGDSPQNHKP